MAILWMDNYNLNKIYHYTIFLIAVATIKYYDILKYRSEVVCLAFTNALKTHAFFPLRFLLLKLAEVIRVLIIT